jgi:hypothetical protein
VAPLYLTSLVLSDTYILPTATKKRKSNLKKLQGEKRREKGKHNQKDRTTIKNGYVDNSLAKIHQNNDMSVG